MYCPRLHAKSRNMKFLRAVNETYQYGVSAMTSATLGKLQNIPMKTHKKRRQVFHPLIGPFYYGI